MRIIGLLCDGLTCCIIDNALAHKMYEYRMLPMRMKPTRKQVNICTNRHMYMPKFTCFDKL